MHEMSLALEVCRLTEEQVGAEALPAITAVGVEVGENAGIVVDNLEFCLEALLSRPPFGAAKPIIERTRGEALRLAWLDIEEGEESV